MAALFSCLAFASVLIMLIQDFQILRLVCFIRNPYLCSVVQIASEAGDTNVPIHRLTIKVQVTSDQTLSRVGRVLKKKTPASINK